MSQYLLHSTIDTQIMDEMANQAPSSDKRVRAVNAELRNLNTKYDIDAGIRSVAISVVTDGSVEYDISTLAIDDDIRKVKSIRYTTDNTYSYLEHVEFEDFMSNMDYSNYKNQFTTYYKDGKMYLRVSTNNSSDAVESLTMRYLTSKLAIDSSGNYYDLVSSGASLYVLLPDTYLDLVVLGACKRLFYQSIGESDQTQVALVRNRYDSELKKLGLSDVAQMIERKVNKIKMHPQY